MSNVNQYVNVMRQTGARVAAANPNSDTSGLQRELIEHYKINKAKAEQLIKNVEASGTPVTSSPVHKMHYEAAVIAIRGYNTPTNLPQPNKVGTPTDVFGAAGKAPMLASKEDTLKNLYAAGWKPL